MKQLLLYLIAFQTATCVLGQTYTFHKTFGGTGYDEGNFIAKTDELGYIICGATNSFNNNNWDISLMKLDSSFNLQWMKSYGADYIDLACCTKQTLDGGYIIVGTASDAPTSNSQSTALIKTDSNGNIQWAKNLATSDFSVGKTIHQMPNGDYYLSGTSDYWPSLPGFYIAKISSSGNLLWAKAYRQMSDTYGCSGQPTKDGGFIIAGSSGIGNTDVALLKTDSAGNVMWSKKYGSLNDNEFGMAIYQNEDATYLIAGYGDNSTYGGYLIKTDSVGNLLWSKNYRDTTYSINFKSICPSPDGGYIIGGVADSLFTGYRKMMALKTSATGNLVWAKTYGETQPFNSNISSIQPISNGFIFLGNNADVYLIKTDTSGNSGCNEKNVSFTEYNPLTTVTSTSVQVISLPTINNYSFTVNSGGIQNNLCYTSIREIQTTSIPINIYPNPLSGQSTLQTNRLLENASLKVYNSLGETVKQLDNLSGQSVILNQDDLPNGIYFMHLMQDNKTITLEKLLIID